MTPDLSRRLGEAVGTKYATPAEQRQIRDAARDAESWDDLPEDIRALVESIESRPDPWVQFATVEDELDRSEDLDDDESDEVLRAGPDPRDGHQFEVYWTKEEGLARWATKPHPWRTLRRLLRKHPEIHDPEGLASHYFHLVFHYWPGERRGSNPVGPG